MAPKASVSIPPKNGKTARLQVNEQGLKTELVPIGELRQHPSNPRAADPELIAQSMRAHGQFRAIVIAKDGTILAGNHTYQAALSLGYEAMWVHRLPVEPDSQQALEIMLADNRTSDFSRYDEAVLAQLLSALDEEGLHASAWDPGDAKRLLEKVAAESPATFPDANPQEQFTHTCPRCGFAWDEGAK